MQHSFSPSLTPEQVTALADLAGYHNSLRPPFGAPLAELTQRACPRCQDWLGEAVLAGYLPGMDGIELALRADRLLWRELLEEYHRKGVDGDSLGAAARAEWYRILIALLEEAVVEFEDAAARIWGLPTAEEHPERIAAMWQEDAAAARRRARAARRRMASASADNEQADAAWQRYADLATGEGGVV